MARWKLARQSGQARQTPQPPQTPRETRPLNSDTPVPDGTGPRLSLLCGACGKVGTYMVGTVLFSPPRDRPLLPDRLWDDMEPHFAFTGYFRCTSCAAGGPWRFPDRTRRALIDRVLRALLGARDTGVFFGETRLFDGTSARLGTDAEAHLQALIDQSPADPYLRDRLANVYRVGGRPDLAEAAYARALGLDPDYVPSLLSLAQLMEQRGDLDQAAATFHRVLTLCRAGRCPFDARATRDVVASALDSLLFLHEQTRGRTPILPPATPDELAAAAREGGSLVLRVDTVDLGTERGREQLVDLYVPRRRGWR